MKQASLPSLRFLALAPLLATSLSFQTRQPPPRNAGQVNQDEDVVSVETTLVTVPVSVMDRQGRFIPDLVKGQFHIYEDGVEQEIAYFDSADSPFTIALLLDMSDSAKFKRADIQAAARGFLDKLRPDDRAIIVAFDKNVTVLSRPTSDRKVLYNAINSTQTGGGTSLYDAVATTISQQLRRIHGRKAIILFTDGVDTTSRATYENTLREAEELDALAYAIQYHTIDDTTKDLQSYALGTNQTVVDVTTSKGEPLATAYKRANLYLRLLTDKTGGRFFYADTLKSLSESFDRIAQELRQKYSISYYPKNQTPGTKPRRINVRVTVPGAAVRARKSYIFRPVAIRRRTKEESRAGTAARYGSFFSNSRKQASLASDTHQSR